LNEIQGRAEAMVAELRQWSRERPAHGRPYLRRLVASGRPFLLHTDLRRALDQELERDPELGGSPLARMVAHAQEAATDGRRIAFALRPRIGEWRHVGGDADQGYLDALAPEDYLRFKESLVLGRSADPFAPTFDLTPFLRELPIMSEARSIGRGAAFLNRTLSGRLFRANGQGDRRLLEFLRLHHAMGEQLLVSDRVRSVEELQTAVRGALDEIETHAGDTPWSELEAPLGRHGLLPGWGRSASSAGETLRLLADLLEAPDPETVERFLSRIPMIFSVVILSPHGWFAQSDVLGRPDTGGQVVYILDQVRALEAEMRRRLVEQGVAVDPKILVVTRLIPDADGTTCDQRLERVAGTDHASILRVPFRRAAGEVLRPWISRFEVWPWLERFTEDVERELLAELGGRPDLVVGNYSDGNLVATLLAQRLGVTQCTIAHALEKSKYLLADLYWKDHDPTHHFAAQFTADLIAMNASDFVIASTYQEIAGTANTVGQYESHSSFTLPGLYRVLKGVDVYDPRFNVVSPGADPRVFFPYDRRGDRVESVHDEIDRLLFGGNGEESRGSLEDPGKPLLFTMARLDRIKNLTGLVSWFANDAELRERANLLVVAGHVAASSSDDEEERAEIERMHELFESHDLERQVRWLGLRLDKTLTGELYRVVADRRGVFVQPALFEAFGLTVIEAMATGLPTFATCFGGPLEIIEDGVSGFHIDPTRGAEAARKIARFLAECAETEERWLEVSRAAIERVERRYTWKLYAERMMTFARTYGFWRFMSDLERAESRRYLELFYALQFRPLAAALTSSAD